MKSEDMVSGFAGRFEIIRRRRIPFLHSPLLTLHSCKWADRRSVHLLFIGASAILNGMTKKGKGGIGLVLAIDVGNSSTTIGLFDERGHKTFHSVLGTDKGSTRDQCAVRLMDVFHLYRVDISTVTGTVISSVVPPITSAMCSAVELLTGRRPILMGPGVKTGLNIRSEIHAQLGTDIVAFSVAAIAKYPSPLVVIDMGTAITMSLLRGNIYDGCIIMPGVRVSLEALSQEAAALPHIAIQPPDSILGRNTVDAMRSGVIYGNASMVDGMLDRIEDEIGGKLAAVVATGAASPEVLHHCRHKIHYDADLLLDGLYLIYQKNTAQRQHCGQTESEI